MGAMDLYFYWPAVSQILMIKWKKYVELNNPLIIGHRISLGDEGCAHGGLGEFVELVMGKSS